MDINKIDANFTISIPQNRDNIKYYDVDNAPFKIYGLLREEEMYCRMPRSEAYSVSVGVGELSCHTTGGRVRFLTDSKDIAIKATMHNIVKHSMFALTGSAGFDLYVKESGKFVYQNAFKPPVDITDGYESILSFETNKMREILIHFPLYAGVSKLFIGLCEGCRLEAAPNYTIDNPIVFYGPSTLQGACASRPGNTYPAIISRVLDCDYINLGFGGSAKGEKEMAEYIKKLSMTAFIYDYDNNAPTPEHLEKTHKRMFDIIRKENPDLPIIILSRPELRLTDTQKKCLEVIKATYETALKNEDKHVYFISGSELISDEIADIYLNDDCHPNDAGFMCMARAIIKLYNTKILGR